MKKLTASEARDLTELAGMSEIYEEISRRAQVGLNTAEFIGEIEKDEFEQLIKDGYKISTNGEKHLMNKFDQDEFNKYGEFTVDWSV